MIDLSRATLEDAINAVPKRFQGPGGLIGVLKDGEIVASRAWGYSDLARGKAMSVDTRMPICSISKQFTCATLLAAVGEPEVLEDKLPPFLPNLATELPSVRQLCHNQSGLRDYWALTVLHGGLAEQTFRREDALPLIARMRSGHFPPGTSYSYCNCNYRILSEMIEAETGSDLETLYQTHIWGPAGMKTAVLTADTRHPEDGVVGYEGNGDHGFIPADNGIYWRGDAGISASLSDMMAYEHWIDAQREDESGLYTRISKQPTFSEGTPAWYGFGLVHERIGTLAATGHGGALRGFRIHRLYCPEARLSVVVMFNHEADAHACARQIAFAALGKTEPESQPLPEGWAGTWIDRDRGMLTRITPGRRTADLQYFTDATQLSLADDDRLVAPDVSLQRAGDALILGIVSENTQRQLDPITEVPGICDMDAAGTYETDELQTEMRIEIRDGAASMQFIGLLGTGQMEPLYPVAQDIWELVTRRSMDAPAPGSWTFTVMRNADGHVTGGTLSCWLARNIAYRKVA
nr:D-aminopeptidase [Tropicimonas sp. IMCC34043]